MQKLMIDIETRGDAELAKTGVYRYAESEFFEILLFAYSVDDGEVKVADLANGEKIPDEIMQALYDNHVEKHAFNANFERVCLSRFTGKHLSAGSWRCTMIASAYLGLPLSLEKTGQALKIEQQKMKEGKALIKFFCTPYGYRDGIPLFHQPWEYPEKWEIFKAYNKRDVEAEMQIDRIVSQIPVPGFVWDEYRLDQEINDRGILIDTELAKSAVEIDEMCKEKLTTELKDITGLDNPNSVTQMKSWLCKNGLEIESLGKKEVAEALNNCSPEIARVLKLRQQLARSSVKKYKAMEAAMCSDHRVRGCFQFYGANRTGRESGKIVQFQNLPQNHLADLEGARKLVKTKNLTELQKQYEDIPDTLSQLIRTALIPAKGKKFIVADYSAIEARVIAWLAGEQWRQKAFAEGKDIYCASASRMFGVPVEKHGINGHLRQKGKISELALGFSGSVGALKAMGALDMGLKEEELQPLVDSWRSSNPNIVKLWYAVDRCAKECIKTKSTRYVNRLKFKYNKGFMFIVLPSGRCLSYAQPEIGENRFGGESITYMGLDSNKRWARLETFGGKLVENITQAIARDILFYALKNLSEYDIVGTVHDEIIAECDKSTEVQTICDIMGKTPPWAEGLILRADGYECDFYKKD